ncbi:hypothetical protein VZG28_04880 [Synechococcus elongatus IITB4]|uniref:hypothetical protein n=1 Tax=Synechococcus elongatus TaxID=32046 RepID=UPI0030D01719
MTNIYPALDRYLHLQAQQQAIKAELEELSAQIIAEFDEDVKTLGYRNMNFQRCERRTYSYSEEIVAREQQLKNDKKAEEKSGAAIAKITTYLRVSKAESPV